MSSHGAAVGKFPGPESITPGLVLVILHRTLRENRIFRKESQPMQRLRATVSRRRKLKLEKIANKGGKLRVVPPTSGNPTLRRCCPRYSTVVFRRRGNPTQWTISVKPAELTNFRCRPEKWPHCFKLVWMPYWKPVPRQSERPTHCRLLTTRSVFLPDFGRGDEGCQLSAGPPCLEFPVFDR